MGGTTSDLGRPARHLTVSVGSQRLRVSVEHPGKGVPLLLEAWRRLAPDPAAARLLYRPGAG